MKVQQQVPVIDSDQPFDRAIRFRVGINIGDAIPDGTDLHGDAVNVVARLQAECPPGGICVSRSVRDHVHGRLGLEFEELGPLSLKNIARPLEVFVLRRDAVAMPQSAEQPHGPRRAQALLLPDKPSLVILPFQNMSSDPEQEYFAEGMVDDLTTAISRFHYLFVIARIRRLPTVDVREIGRQ